MNTSELLWQWLRQWLTEAPTSKPKTPAVQALDRKLVTHIDLVRLKVIARLHARGLAPHMDWADLLQEAFSRVLDGSRSPPDGVPIIAFLAGIMRSIKSEQWRRSRACATGLALDSSDERAQDLCDSAPDALRRLIAMDEVAAIRALFADDAPALQIIDGLYEGRTAEEIRARHGMSATDYESTRKRIRRTLVKEGLRWSPEP